MPLECASQMAYAMIPQFTKRNLERTFLDRDVKRDSTLYPNKTSAFSGGSFLSRCLVVAFSRSRSPFQQSSNETLGCDSVAMAGTSLAPAPDYERVPISKLLWCFNVSLAFMAPRSNQFRPIRDT
jgi:hypothetical protein